MTGIYSHGPSYFLYGSLTIRAGTIPGGSQGQTLRDALTHHAPVEKLANVMNRGESGFLRIGQLESNRPTNPEKDR